MHHRVTTWAGRLGEAALLVLAYVVDLLTVGDGSLRGGGHVPEVVLRVVAVPFFLTLLVRRRRHRLVLGVVLGYSVLAAALVPDYEPFTAVLVALFTVASRDGRAAATTALVAVTPLVVLNSLNAGGPDARPRDYGLAALLWAVIVGIDWTAGRLTYRAARTAEFREAALVAEASLAVQRERLRLAREIHDSVANAVSGMVLQAAGARATATPSSAEATLQTIEESGVRAMRELRRLLVLLRSDADLELSEAGSISQLEQLVGHARSVGVVVDLAVHGHPVVLDQSVDHAAYRVVGECLANAAKHGGAGARVHLQLQWGEQALHITSISRRGVGRPALVAAGSIGSGFGLVGMAERVQALGGTLSHGESANGDFVVDADLPVAPAPVRPGAHPWSIGGTDG